MRGNVCKKTITLIYLITILFSLFFPFNQSYAQYASNTLQISIAKKNLNLTRGEETMVTASLSGNSGKKNVTFKVEGNEEAIYPKQCTLPDQPISSCYIKFKSLIDGTFTIKATIYLEDGSIFKEITSKPIIIKTCSGSEIIVEGICKEPKNILPAEPKVNTDTTYTPLAPLPGFPEEFDTLPSKTNQCPFGNYLNIMIKLVIGIAAVLAMVMIVMGGIEYMTSDLISSKEAGKDTIKNALLGLFIALGAYLILNTINPKLLSACLDNLPEAVIEIEEAPPTASDFSLNETPPTGKLGSCTGEITKISTSGGTITLCSTIANQVKEIIDKAQAKGLKLSGWGWRSKKRTEELRVINGCPDIYKSPPSKCRVPTAIPGTSMHESGLAIDFTCNGISVQTRDNVCYLWLKDNPNIHKLLNLKTEAWHWSTNGR